MFRILRYSSLATAALVLVALVVSFFLIDHHAGLAFADMVQKVQEAKSVTFRCKQKLTPQSPTLEQRWYMQGDGVRLEMPGVQEAFQTDLPVIMAFVANLKEKKALQLDYHGTVATWLPVDKEVGKQFTNPIEQLRKLKDQDARREADE